MYWFYVDIYFEHVDIYSFHEHILHGRAQQAVHVSMVLSDAAPKLCGVDYCAAVCLLPRRPRLRELKAARRMLRDFNAAAGQQLAQHAAASDAAAAQLIALRADLDAAHACIRHARLLMLLLLLQVVSMLLWQILGASVHC
jgi:hypothetical protein